MRRTLALCAVATLLAGPAPGAAVKRILLVGDSWMAGTWLSKAGDKALQANGLGDFETEGADTAIGGSRADQWANNHQGKLDKLHAALQKYPEIDIVHLCIGGNDFLRFALGTNLAALTPEVRAAQWAAIRKDIQKIVDDILAQRDNLRVVISDYDYLDPALMAKVYKAGPGFESAFFGVDVKTFNEALIELGRQKLSIARNTPRCYYVQNWGLLQSRYKYAPSLKVRLPGAAPDYNPYPGGDPAYSSGAAMPDGVHPTPEGFQFIFENAVRQFYARWLREAPEKAAAAPPAAGAPASIGPAVNVREAPYLAKGDGKTDDTAAFQRALDDAGRAGGGIIFAPTGRYLIGTHLWVPAGVSLVGAGRAPQRYAPEQPATTLLAIEGAGKPDGTPFLTLAGPNSTLEGIAILYPDQVVANPPVAYPWTIRAGGGENISLINLLLANPYQAVDFATNKSARHYIRGLYGQPLRTGIRVDQCYDIGRIKDVHFWPFWSLDKKIIDYTTTHATGFVFQRTDWEIVDDIFVWGYRVGVELSASAQGAMNGQMANINLDNVDIGIDVSDTQPYAVHVSNLNIANAGAGTDHVGIWGRNGKGSAELSVRGASFWGSLHQALRWETAGTVSLSDSRVVQWTLKRPALEILKGQAMIHDVSFNAWRKRVGPAFGAGADAGRVSFHHNQLNGNQIAGDLPAFVELSNNQP